MDFSTTVTVDDSSGVITDDVQSMVASDVNQEITIKLFIRRPESVSDYADQILNGTAGPLSREEFSKRFSSSDEDIALVCEFAEHYNFNVDKSHADSATITLTGTIGSFNNAFNTTLNEITNTEKTYRSHSGQLSIPAELKGIILHISGQDNYYEGALRPMLTGYNLDQNGSMIDTGNLPAAALPGSVGLTPVQVAQAYNFPNSDGYGQTVAILQFGGGYTQDNFISSFTNQGYTIPDISDVYVQNATNNPDDIGSSAEVMLDSFVVGVVAPKAKQVIYFGPNNNAFLADVFNAALYDTVNAPSVISVSWGYIEDGWLLFYSGYIAGINDVLASAAVLGITITNSSGDYGSIPYDYGAAYANTVSMIASSPYVLGCGGTSLLLHANNVTKTEVVWNHDGSGTGGGKSKLWGTPTYQQGRRIRNWTTVTGALQTLNTAGVSSTTSSANNINVRGVPDVAGNADGSTGYTFYYGRNNSGIQAGGTSAVSPLWAGLIARLNQLSGKRMGFMNPMLYINTHVFRDITSGNNVVLYGVGYGANTGWDACTGLGTPKGNALYQLVRTGYVYPKSNYGFRTRTSSSYPRITRR